MSSNPTIAAPAAEPLSQQPIVFFDDVCSMCNWFVSLVVRADKQGVIRFAPLRGETARRLLPPLPDDPTRWSMLYLDEQGLHSHSDASLAIYRRLGGIFWPLSLFRFVPRFLRDPVYRLVSRNRYRWFGRQETCRVPTAAERSRFLP